MFQKERETKLEIYFDFKECLIIQPQICDTDYTLWSGERFSLQY